MRSEKPIEKPWAISRKLFLCIVLSLGLLLCLKMLVMMELPIFSSPLAGGEKDTGMSQFYYSPPNKTNIIGEVLKTTIVQVERLNLLSHDYVTLNDGNLQDFVFATAASSAFFPRLQESIALVQIHRPNDTLYFYDLGLEKSQAEQIKNMCHVKYKTFNFHLYPRHFRNLHNYAWKPAIIAEVLTEHPGVFWIDTSVKLLTGNFSALFQQVKVVGAVSVSTTGHSTFAVTHPQMYDYLPPGDLYALMREEQREASAYIMYRTKEIKTRVLKFMILCALEENCIAPKSRLGCNFGGDRWSRYAHCHRFDQSIFNILMWHRINYASSSKYFAKDIVKVERGVSGKVGKPKTC